jgi:hypothetical protein
VTAIIDVARVEDADPIAFEVRLRDGESESRHHVTLSRADFIRLGADATAEEVIDAAFRFLLDREPGDAILARFDVSVISRYFPDFEAKLAAYL